MTEDRGERLQKVLARAGVASRRRAESLIAEGRVTVDGKTVTEPGTRVDPARHTVAVDGRPIEREGKVYLLLHKPPGMVTTLSDPEGRPTVGDLVKNVPERVFPVGRLDYDAEGVLLLTNDGELANRLTHPRFGVRRTYDAKVRGVPVEATLDRLRAGIRLEDGHAKPLSVEVAGRATRNTWVRLAVAEGRPHLVKRLFEAVGHPVQRLRRVDYAGLTVDELAPGEMRPLLPNEVAILQDALASGEASKAPRGRGRRPGPPPGKRPDQRPGKRPAAGHTEAKGAGEPARPREAVPDGNAAGKTARGGKGGRRTEAAAERAGGTRRGPKGPGPRKKGPGAKRPGPRSPRGGRR
jgi:23S rRNA pseudouridine2605 synthase